MHPHEQTPEQKTKILRRLGPGRRKVTACHEAGHVLAHLYLGQFLDRAVVRSVAELLDGPHTTRNGSESDCEGMVEGPDCVSSYYTPDMNMSGATPEGQAYYLRSWTIGAEMDMLCAYAGMYAEARHTKQSVSACMLLGGSGDMDLARHRAKTWFRGAERALHSQ